MNVDSILQKFEHFGVCLGLESIQRLLKNLGNPHQQVPIIHVAGSNGKGSVCAYLSAVLTEAGYRTGRYISPHLVSWNERICINEQQISADELEKVLDQVIAAISPDEPSPTQFEVITAAMWLYFAQQKVDIAVIEVGLGGRLDATNVSGRPLVSIITSISREHWQRLGPTLADIAGEKAGILKPACPAVVGQLPPEAKTVIDRRIADLGCPVTYPQPAQLLDPENPSLAPSPYSLTPLQWATAQGIAYPLPLQGDIQLHNSALAIAALQILREQGWKISDEAIANGMAKTKWAARLQWFTWRDRKILIDGAHNPASAEVLRRFVDARQEAEGRGQKAENTRQEVEGSSKLKIFPTETLREQNSKLKTSHSSLFTLHSSLPPFPIHWVMGMLSTKDHADVFKALLRGGDRLYLVPVPDHSSADPTALAKLAIEVCPGLADCQTAPDVLTALELATSEKFIDQAGEPPLTVLCGSLYLIGHFFGLVNAQT